MFCLQTAALLWEEDKENVCSGRTSRKVQRVGNNLRKEKKRCWEDMSQTEDEKLKNVRKDEGGNQSDDSFSFTVLHVHLDPLMDGSEIREKENGRFIRLQMRSLLCSTEAKGSEGQKQATKTCVLPGSPSITKITLPPPSDLRWILMLKSTLIMSFSKFISDKRKTLRSEINRDDLSDTCPKLFSLMR